MSPSSDSKAAKAREVLPLTPAPSAPAIALTAALSLHGVDRAQATATEPAECAAAWLRGRWPSPRGGAGDRAVDAEADREDRNSKARGAGRRCDSSASTII